MTDHYIFESPVGLLKICETDGKITGLSPLPAGADTVLTGNCGQHSDLLYEAYNQLREYFSGRRMRFDLPLGYNGTAFQQKVWAQLQNIPYGETRSYEDIAASTGNKKAVRAVGQANHKNPILILIPCHRVIHKNGSISGFACGIEVKKYLLNLEKDSL